MTGQKDFHVRIPPHLTTRLELLASERKVAQKWLIVDALEEYLGGGRELAIDTLQSELAELKRRLGALRGDVEIVAELLSFYIFHWLGYTPRLEKTERAALAVEAKERHGRFIEMFVKKLEMGELGLAAVYAAANKKTETVGEGESTPVTESEI